jgi:hypothetical protein
MSNELYLILHKVRGEPAFDVACRLDIGSAGGWIIPTSGHRAYPYRWWLLEDLSDISDINYAGVHERPASLDHTMPADWPDHYRAQEAPPPRPVKAKLGSPINLGMDEGIVALLSDLDEAQLTKILKECSK